MDAGTIQWYKLLGAMVKKIVWDCGCLDSRPEDAMLCLETLAWRSMHVHALGVINLGRFSPKVFDVVLAKTASK